MVMERVMDTIFGVARGLVSLSSSVIYYQVALPYELEEDVADEVG